jgi:hypothetical protein
MMQTKPLNKTNIASIGEEIGYELGNQMVKDFQQANPNDIHYYVIGRNIIDQILSQPGCVGIKFYGAYDEQGAKTMVYVGLDENGKALLQYSCVESTGKLGSKAGIVADRIDRGGRTGSVSIDADNWSLEID